MVKLTRLLLMIMVISLLTVTVYAIPLDINTALVATGNGANLTLSIVALTALAAGILSKGKGK